MAFQLGYRATNNSIDERAHSSGIRRETGKHRVAIESLPHWEQFCYAIHLLAQQAANQTAHPLLNSPPCCHISEWPELLTRVVGASLPFVKTPEKRAQQHHGSKSSQSLNFQKAESTENEGKHERRISALVRRVRRVNKTPGYFIYLIDLLFLIKFSLILQKASRGQALSTRARSPRRKLRVFSIGHF